MTVVHDSEIRVIDRWNHADGDDISTPRDETDYRFTQAFADGSAANQAQDMYRANRSVAVSAADELDLAGGLTDRFGNTLTFTTIKQVLVVNLSTTEGENLLVGGNAGGTGGTFITDLFDGDAEGRVKLRRGGCFLVVVPGTGYTVTAGSADILRIENAGTDTIEYDVVIKGIR